MYKNADVEKTQAPIDEREYVLKQRIDNDCCQAARALTSEEIVARMFSYHPPNSETIPKYAAINQAAKNFAEVVLQNCPRGADLSATIRLIREARMTANAAIALDGLSLY